MNKGEYNIIYMFSHRLHLMSYFFSQIKTTYITASINIFISLTNLISSSKDQIKTVKNVCNAFNKGNISLKSILEYIIHKFRLKFSQILECGHVESHDDFYDITYYVSSRKYRIRFPKKHGLRQILSVKSLHGEDLTEKTIEFMGPSKNFHGIPTTPNLMGHEGLIIKYRNGKIVNVRDDDVILLSL